MKVNLVTAVCCVVVCMANICAGSVPTITCSCQRYSPTRINVTKLRSFTCQSALHCGIRAIRFVTKLNKVICSDPNSDWANSAMKYLNAKDRPAKTEPIPVTTPRKEGPSPTNPTTESPVQDRGSTLTIESTPSKPTPNFPGQGSTPTSFIPSSVEKRATKYSSPNTKSPVQDRGPPITPTTMTTHQETQTTRRPVHRDTSPRTALQKGGSSPTNPTTKSPVQDRGRGIRLYLCLLTMSCFLIVVFDMNMNR